MTKSFQSTPFQNEEGGGGYNERYGHTHTEGQTKNLVANIGLVEVGKGCMMKKLYHSIKNFQDFFYR